MTKRGAATQWATEGEDLNTTEIRELYRQTLPEVDLVSQFHALWDGNDQYQPTSTDRTRARDILKTYGQDAEKLLPLVVEVMRERFPGAKSFGASGRYWIDAAKNAEHERASADRRRQEFIEQELEEGKARQQKADLSCWQAEWDKLSPADHDAIKQKVLANTSASLRLDKFPSILHRFCLKELGQRLQSR